MAKLVSYGIEYKDRDLGLDLPPSAEKGSIVARVG